MQERGLCLFLARVENDQQKMSEEKKPKRGRDTTGAQRQRDLRASKPKLEAFVTPEQFAEAMTLIASGECTDKADVVRQAVHEKYLRFIAGKA